VGGEPAAGAGKEKMSSWLAAKGGKRMV